MSQNLKAYEQQLFAKHHYRKLIAAKTTIPHFKESKESIHCHSRTLTPLDRYEYQLTNDKIRSKLVQIYKDRAVKPKKHTEEPRKHSKSVNLVGDRQKQKTIDRQNIKMFCRIVEARSIIGQNWKKREKSLKKYSQITRRKVQWPDDSLFQAYKQILAESRVKTAKSRKSSRRSKCKSRPVSGRESTNQVNELRMTT